MRGWSIGAIAAILLAVAGLYFAGGAIAILLQGAAFGG